MKNFFKKLFGRKPKELGPIIKPKGSEKVITSSYSQDYVLQHRMREQNIEHGSIVDVNLINVRIRKGGIDEGPGTKNKFVIYFCPLHEVEINQVMTEGDAEELPSTVKLHGFNLPSNFVNGIYNINNVILHANGSLNVITKENTTLELVSH